MKKNIVTFSWSKKMKGYFYQLKKVIPISGYIWLFPANLLYTVQCTCWISRPAIKKRFSKGVFTLGLNMDRKGKSEISFFALSKLLWQIYSNDCRRFPSNCEEFQQNGLLLGRGQWGTCPYKQERRNSSDDLPAGDPPDLPGHPCLPRIPHIFWYKIISLLFPY